jgi:hypothetical protein
MWWYQFFEEKIIKNSSIHGVYGYVMQSTNREKVLYHAFSSQLAGLAAV